MDKGIQDILRGVRMIPCCQSLREKALKLGT